jgi:RNA polymerase sigma-70 factor (ECF subfamily)
MSEQQKTLNVNAPELANIARLARALPAECRQAFTLRKVYGYSGREIANRLGIPERAVEELLIQAACACAQTNAPDIHGLVHLSSLLKRLRSRIAHE